MNSSTDDKTLQRARQAQADRDALMQHEWEQQGREAAARCRDHEYLLPEVPGRAAIAPADDPWRALNTGDVAALEPDDQPPDNWKELQEDTRRCLVGLAAYLLRVCPSDPADDPGRRRKRLASLFDVCLRALAGEDLAGYCFPPAESKFFGHFTLEPSDRAPWALAQLDAHLHGAWHVARELVARLDRPGPGVLERLRARVAAALEQLRPPRHVPMAARPPAVPTASEQLADERAQRGLIHQLDRRDLRW